MSAPHPKELSESDLLGPNLCDISSQSDLNLDLHQPLRASVRSTHLTHRFSFVWTNFKTDMELQHGMDMLLVPSSGLSVRVHRCLMAASSPLLRDLLVGSHQEEVEVVVLLLPEVEDKVLGHLVDLVYTGRTLISLSSLSPLQKLCSSLHLSLPSVTEEISLSSDHNYCTELVSCRGLNVMTWDGSESDINVSYESGASLDGMETGHEERERIVGDEGSFQSNVNDSNAISENTRTGSSVRVRRCLIAASSPLFRDLLVRSHQESDISDSYESGASLNEMETVREEREHFVGDEGNFQPNLSDSNSNSKNTRTEDTKSILSCTSSDEDTLSVSSHDSNMITDRSLPDNAVDLSCPRSGEKRVELEGNVENDDRLLTSKLQENHVKESRNPVSSNYEATEETRVSCSNSEASNSTRTTDVQNNKGIKVKKRVKIPFSSRYVVHNRNHLVWDQEREEHSDCLYDWVALRSRAAIKEFIDITPGEKEFFIVWNQWLHKLEQDVGRIHLERVLSRFVAEEGRHIIRKGLHRQFVLHLLNLEQENLLGGVHVIRLTRSIQNIAESTGH